MRLRALTVACLLLFAAGAPFAATVAAQERPHDPWVFRSVLDGNARMLTVALHEDLWVAYDTQDGRLHRVWKGDVDFDGAVYTTVHGPQPESRGAGYMEGREAPLWELRRGDTTRTTAARYAGYEIQDDRLLLIWELGFDDGIRLQVKEEPSAEWATETELLRFSRVFTAYGLAEGDQLTLRVTAHIDRAAVRVLRTGDRTLIPFSATPAASEAVPLSLRLPLERLQVPGLARVYLSFYLSEPGGVLSWDELPQALARVEEMRAEVDGLRDVLDRREQPGHVAEPERSAPAAGAAAGAAAGESVASEPEIIEDEATGPREHGVSVRVYAADRSLSALPVLVPGQTPNVSFVAPVLDLDGQAGRGFGLDDEFVTVVDGFIEVTTAGEHGFRLTSDDGSELWIAGTRVIDHGGLHGPEAKDGTLELAAGVHPFQVRHFENGGGERLALAWLPPGADDFELIPTEALSCRAGQVRVTSPGAKQVLLPLERASAGDGSPLLDVHPAFELATVRPDDFQPKVGGMAFLPDGRLVICTWDADGAVYVLDGVQGDDPSAITATRIAAGLAEPLGLEVVDGRIFVLQKQELTELIDTDGDELIDEYRCVSAGWDVTANFHEFAFGLVYRDGFFYANLAVAIEPGGASSKHQPADRGTTIRIDPESGEYTTVARGLRTPNGIGRGPDGAIYVTDNQGDWLPVSKLLRLEHGAFYGSYAVTPAEVARLPVTPPVVWLPQGEIGNSPTEPTAIPGGIGPYAGQMIHGDVTHGGVKRVFVEQVEGARQGAVFRFTQGLEAGVNRLVWGPDGALYVGGVGSTGNWGQTGKQRFGLQRLRYTGAPVFELLAVRAHDDGLELEFTEPLAEGLGWEPAAYRVTQWRYEPTPDYGGPKLDSAELGVVSASPSPDGRRVFLELDGLRAEHVVHVHLAGPFESQAGRTPWTTEAWYTLNRIPRGAPGKVRERPAEPPQNVLTDAERAEGWELLFDGETSAGWHGFKRDGFPDVGWAIEDGCIVHRKAGGGGDIVTDGTYGDFELKLQWRISPGGNSGIFFRVSEADDRNWVWETGPEMQVLDNDRHADGRSPLTSAGANYALHAPPRDVTRPVGLFNDVHLIVRGGRVEHRLNGVTLLEYDLDSEAWEQLVAGSKFSGMPGYGRERSGHIALQDHGDLVWYRNLEIRRLAP